MSDSSASARGSASPPPREVTRFVAKVVVWGLAVLVAVAVGSVGADLDLLGILLGAVVITFAQTQTTLWRHRGARAEVLSSDEVVVPFLLVFLGPVGAVLSMFLGAMAANFIIRRGRLQRAYNISLFVAGTGMGAGVAWVLGDVLGPELRVFAVAAGAITFAFAMASVHARLVHHLTGEAWGSVLVGEVRRDGSRMVAQSLLGVLAAVASQEMPILAPVGVLATLAVLATHQRWFSIQRDRERLNDLLPVSTSIHGEVSVVGVEAALIEATRTMVGGQVVLSTDPDQPAGAMVVPVDGGSGSPTQIVVTRMEPFDATEVAIVEALGRVAEVSLRVAALVELYAEQSEQFGHLVEQRERFLLGTAQTLRRPLKVVLGFGRSLAEGADDPELVAEMSEQIVREASSMADSLDEMLVEARSAFEELLVAPAPIDLRHEVEAVVSEQRSDAPVTIVGSARAVGDPARLRQIVRGLLRNALEHGEPPVEVAVGEGSGRAFVAVADFGPGPRDGTGEDLFQPFARTGEDAEVPGVAGLGLHAARQLAMMMGGDVVYRREGDRTVFRVELPRSIDG